MDPCPEGTGAQEKTPRAFGREERVRKRADHQRVYREGAKFQSRHFRASVCPNTLPHRRLGVTAGKRIGPAVRRNRLKRRIREFFRLNKDLLPPSCDFVITAREGAADLSFREVSEELKGLLMERSSKKGP
ncbi:MAG TPA: ribonuclease P protein component [Thermodesulfobacteriota bacterium]|nr:ribonuclease P protein component [Thermodesulfobacteriota bacterium]